jgi:hypothetical protein
LVFNKNIKISSLTTAIITISLSFLPLNVGGHHTSVLLPFSTEPVFAQLSEQSIPYREEPVPTTTSTSSSSSSSSSSIMDSGLFLDSFANSIFNGTSTFAGVGTSIVDDIDVSGISLDKSQNKLSVTLSRAATTQAVRGGNNNITSADTTVTALSIPNSTSVSVIAMRIPITTSDILSIAAASSSSSSSSSLTALDSSLAGDTTENQLNSFPSDSFNPFSLLSSLQIGSSTLTEVDWSEPQTVSMDLIGSSITIREQEQQLNSANAKKADFVPVSVIPFTDVGNNTTSSTT